MKNKKVSLSHVALLVSSVEKSAAFLKKNNFESKKPEIFEAEGSKEIYVGEYSKQSALLLLVEPVGKGPYKNAFEKRGSSLHHIAIDVIDLAATISNATELGWKLHPVSEKSIEEYQTAWLYKKGIPTLIEVHQRKSLTDKPSKVSKIELPIEGKDILLFHKLGIDEIEASDRGLRFTVDGISFSFDQIANP